ncbi:TlpA family protein disulfide reductase [Labedella populi]|uniref:TlpA family protein disulfide reductase n=1 Tax=Labedella populi TaxID=2498850 RepID=UPI00140DBAC3|nr:TlpA disulfide reductase family protein [Labedella populi]
MTALLLTLLLPLTACSSAPAAEQEPAPELVGTDLEGRTRDLADLRGHTVLVTVWASWCAPCREEAPMIRDAATRWEDDGLRVLGINFRDNATTARAFVDSAGLTFPSIVDADGSLSVEWGITGIPQSFVVDADGVIVARRIGPITAEWIDSDVRPVVVAPR